MRRVATVIATGLLLSSGSALAKDYGDAGTIELGGNVFFESTSTKLEDDDNNFKTDESGTDITLAPDVFYYLMPGLPIIGGIELGMENQKDNEDDSTSATTGFGVGVGTGYFVKVGAARLGPAAQLRFSQETTKTDDGAGVETETTLSGPGVRLGALAKLPIGSGGVITAGLFMNYDTLKEKVKDVDGETDVTSMSFGTTVGVSVWF